MNIPVPLELLRLSDAQLSAIRPLFAQVFRHEISPQLLDWKYGGRRGQSWIARQGANGDILVHCGVFFRNILFHGDPVRAGQLVDLMASPKGAGLTRQNSPFALLLSKILRQMADERNPDAITFGFPSGRSMRLAEHTGVATEVDHWHALHITARQVPGAPKVRNWQATSSGEVEIANRAWQAMRADFAGAVLGVRDFDYIEQRYLRHPSTSYCLLVIESRWLGKPIGMAVTRNGEAHSELLDIIGRWEDMPAILRGLQNWLALAGRESLVLCLTENFARQLSPFADQISPTEFRIMGNPYCTEATLAKMRQHCWLTGGDTDYR